MTAEKNLNLIEAELRFISRQLGRVEGANGNDFETVDELAMAAASALRALFEYKLSLQPEVTEEAADYLVTTYEIVKAA